MTSTTTQKMRVITYAKQNNGITTYQAFRDLYITDLQSVIRDIKKLGGYEVTDRWEAKPNKDGKINRYKRYFVKEIN